MRYERCIAVVAEAEPVTGMHPIGGLAADGPRRHMKDQVVRKLGKPFLTEMRKNSWSSCG